MDYIKSTIKSRVPENSNVEFEYNMEWVEDLYT